MTDPTWDNFANRVRLLKKMLAAFDADSVSDLRHRNMV